MYNKGQMTIGGLIMIAIAIITALILFQASAGNLWATTAPDVTVTNYQLTTPANGASVDLPGQELTNTPTVLNRTDSVDLTGNYTIAEGVSPRTGTKRIIYTTTTAAYAAKNVNVSYTYKPEGYADDAGARAVIPLILIFTALAIAIVALEPTLRSKIVEMVR